MGRFNDLVSSVGVGDDGITLAYPDTFIDDLKTAYAEDMAIPDAAVAVLKAENAELQQKVTLLQAENYELIRQIPSTPSDPEPGEGDGEDDDTNDEDITTDDLFGDADDNDKDKD